MDKTKFDDWSDVKECNQCEEYWTSACDGTLIGSEKPCTAFKAVRRVSIPLEIESLRKAVKWLSFSLVLLGVAVTLHLIYHLVVM